MSPGPARQLTPEPGTVVESDVDAGEPGPASWWVSSRWGAAVRRWPPEVRDAVVYGISAVFALLTMELADISLYRQWAELALGPYVAATVLMAAVSWWRGRARRRAAKAGTAASTGARRLLAARVAAFGIVLIGATLAPLTLEVIWRSEGNASEHVQPEVLVVERAGVRAERGKDPYQVVDRNGHILIHQSDEPVYELYYPYLPGMVIFGFSSASKVEARLTDARDQFLIFTLAVTVVALSRLRGASDPRFRALQVLTVLPTAALPLSTGGDDMPVAALMLAGVVALQRRRPLVAGLALGAASCLKFTAWPLTVLAVWAARDLYDRRAPLRYSVGAGALLAAVVLPFAFSNPSAFVDNVIRFPLGLAGVASPAASPLPGHLIVSTYPGMHRVYVVVVLVLGLAVLAWRLTTHPPRTPAQVATLTAWVMLVAIVLAPATRVGYLLYPVNLFVWGWMLRRAEVPSAPAEADQVESGTWKMRMENGVVPTPSVGETMTPVSQ